MKGFWVSVALVLSMPLAAYVMPSRTEVECARKAAEEKKVPLFTLLLLRSVEAGAAGTFSWNDNGTADLGPWQINTIWFARLGLKSHINIVAHDVCVNAMVAAHILRHELDLAKGDLSVAITAYHSKTKRFADLYRQRLAEAAPRLLLHLQKTKL